MKTTPDFWDIYEQTLDEEGLNYSGIDLSEFVEYGEELDQLEEQYLRQEITPLGVRVEAYNLTMALYEAILEGSLEPSAPSSLETDTEPRSGPSK